MYDPVTSCVSAKYLQHNFYSNIGLIFVLYRLCGVGEPLPPPPKKKWLQILLESYPFLWKKISYPLLLFKTLPTWASFYVPISTVKESVCPYSSNLLKIIWLWGEGTAAVVVALRMASSDLQQHSLQLQTSDFVRGKEWSRHTQKSTQYLASTEVKIFGGGI
jgi:hypothetical protein